MVLQRKQRYIKIVVVENLGFKSLFCGCLRWPCVLYCAWNWRCGGVMGWGEVEGVGIRVINHFSGGSLKFDVVLGFGAVV